jgi:hypothetical protein
MDIYDPGYIEGLDFYKKRRDTIFKYLKSTSDWTAGTLKVLAKNFLRIDEKRLSRVDPLVLSMVVNNLLTGRGNLRDRLNEFEYVKLTAMEGIEFLFWANPEKFPLPDKAYIDPIKYIKIMRSELKKAGFKNFIELELFKNGFRDTFKREIIDTIRHLTINDDMGFARELYNYLDPLSKAEVEQDHTINPYIMTMLKHKVDGTVVVDGSNILMLDSFPDLKNIDNLFRGLSKYKKRYYPVYLVFDNNAQFMVNMGKWSNYKYTYFHSPADELILSMAKNKKCPVISRDKYRDWSYFGEILDPFEIMSL